jgi:hypothetical protein
MPTQPQRTPVRGSEWLPLPGARAVGPVPKDERFEVTVRVRRRAPLAGLAAGGFQSSCRASAAT